MNKNENQIPTKKLDKKSVVTYFNYGGYGDYVDGIVEMEIYDSKKNPMKSKFILEIDNKKEFIETDENGFVKFYVINGTHNIKISKDNFQPLLISNYISNSDQITSINIALENGDEIQNFKCPKWHE